MVGCLQGCFPLSLLPKYKGLLMVLSGAEFGWEVSFREVKSVGKSQLNLGKLAVKVGNDDRDRQTLKNNFLREREWARCRTWTPWHERVAVTPPRDRVNPSTRSRRLPQPTIPYCLN